MLLCIIFQDAQSAINDLNGENFLPLFHFVSFSYLLDASESVIRLTHSAINSLFLVSPFLKFFLLFFFLYILIISEDGGRCDEFHI